AALPISAALRVNRQSCAADLAALECAIRQTDAAPMSDNEAADAFIERIEKLAADIGIPQRLANLGVRPEQIETLVPASRGNSMSGNPREMSDAELAELLRAML